MTSARKSMKSISMKTLKATEYYQLHSKDSSVIARKATLS